MSTKQDLENERRRRREERKKALLAALPRSGGAMALGATYGMNIGMARLPGMDEDVSMPGVGAIAFVLARAFMAKPLIPGPLGDALEGAGIYASGKIGEQLGQGMKRNQLTGGT